MIKKEKMEYSEGNITLEAHYAFNDTAKKLPTILVFHDWSGRNEFAIQKAEKLAELGYLGVAVDMFGKGKLGTTKEEKMALMKPFIDDRQLLQKRALAGLEAVKKLDNVDTKKIGAIGFCFGGMCALDLARSGADISGVVSFHGLLGEPEKIKKNKIAAKILVLTGHDDPMATFDQVLSFQREMTEANVDWQVHIYGRTMHAFTNPLANDHEFGLVYNALAEKRSWIEMKDFFAEVLG